MSEGQPIQNTTSQSPLDVIEEWKTPTTSNHTIGEFIDQQTENVKKNVDQKQQTSTMDYPVVTKLEPDYSAEVKKQIDKLTLEELKIKCQHFSKLFQVNKTNASNKSSNQNGSNSSQNTAARPINHRPYDPQRRPIYIQQKTTFKPKYYTTSKPNGFYITQSTVTQKPVVNTQPTPIKYIRLEPVILQKTILNDGRIVYYWHRSLPTAVEIVNNTAEDNNLSTSLAQQSYNNYYGQPPVYNTYSIPYSYENMLYRLGSLPQTTYTSNNYLPVHQNIYTSTEDSSVEQKSTETTEPSTISTTEQISYGYGFGSFLPFYGYRRDSTTTTTTAEPTTTTTTTTPPTEKQKTEDLVYAQQLKFIVPLPYEELTGGTSISSRNPWSFDRYAYYPKELQPSAMNVQVPYNPTFHMIRAVAVPSSVSKLSDEVNLS